MNNILSGINYLLECIEIELVDEPDLEEVLLGVKNQVLDIKIQILNQILTSLKKERQ